MFIAYAYLYDDSDTSQSVSSRTASANQGIDMLSMTDEERLAMAIAASRSEHNIDNDMKIKEATNDNNQTVDTVSMGKGKEPANGDVTSYTGKLNDGTIQ
jgi:FKBP-type peptidyl-prolyl cis-trans isomerase